MNCWSSARWRWRLNHPNETAHMKHQTPNTKHQINTKLQTPKQVPSVASRWSLVFGAYLVFGVWCVVFSSP